MRRLIAQPIHESSSASIEKVAPKFSPRQNEEIIYDMDEIFARFLTANKCISMTDTAQMLSSGLTCH